jgi:carbamoyl-phosphate synthase large subunit
VLAQRYVVGEEYNVLAVRDEKSGKSCAVTMRKTLVTRLGKAWAGVTVEDPAIREFASKVTNGLNWHGPCEVELLKGNDGSLYLIEVNPRFPAWVYLSAAAGVNLPLALVRIALGYGLDERAEPKAGVFYVRHAVELTGDTQDLAQLVSHGRMSSRPTAI